MTFIASDRSGHYQTLEPVTREQIIRFAHSLLTRQFRNRRKITSSEDVRQWLVMKLALENRESFGVIMLSQQHHILGYQTLFTGTLSQTMVYPREIVSLALTHNAAAVIHSMGMYIYMGVSTLFSEYRRSWCQITSGLNVSQPRCVLQ